MSAAARSHCTFRLAGEPFALALAAVREVRRAPVITAVRGAPPEVNGLVNLHGRIATVLDVGAALGLQARARGDWLVVLAGGAEWLALRVDEVGETVELAADAIEPLLGADDWLLGVAEHGGQSLRVLDAARISAEGSR